LDIARLDSQIAQGLDVLSVRAFYLCGPSEMIFSMKEHLEQKGVSTERIRFELFSAPAPGADDSEQKAEVPSSDGLVNTYILDGERFEVEVKDPDMTILDIGLDHGIDLPFACQGGVCCTCRAQVLEGEVDMRQNFSLSSSEVEEGFVLTCQSYPKGGSATLDYDA
ncbi:MAG: 2Fe-2S iron-sulfur cluster binding domain-containing protein, partial [Flavobacteriales bacterium]|nr:2Fe-2S iron-sulfur cluster binding domain-containing protein [Flavobacteriales bacterium]